MKRNPLMEHAMNLFRTFTSVGRSCRRWSRCLAAVMLLASALNAFAQAPAAKGGAAPPLSAEELTKLVGPIALYPDDLVAIILPASTSPLQIVQADRYLEKRKSDPKVPVDSKWDDPVKSLLNYPDVVKMMSNDLDWAQSGHNLPLGMPTHLVRKRTPFPNVVGAAVLVSRNRIPFLAGLPARAGREVHHAGIGYGCVRH